MNAKSVYTNPHSARAAGGFTLIELIAVLSVLAIVLAIALPSMREGINTNRAQGQARDVIGDLQFARTESLNRANNISICPSTNGTSCAGTWPDGWIIFVDNGATKGSVDLGEEILRIHGDLGSSLLTVMSGAATSAAMSTIRFDRRGTSSRTTVLLCADGGDESFARAVLIENSGRVAHSRRGSSGIHIDVKGNDVVC
jgi:type IV fimbrial biogenesis protein FimT